MIRRVYEQAKKSRLLTDVVVATDNRDILNTVINFGGKAVMTSSKHKSGTDRIREAMKYFPSDIIVNLQGDEPYVNPGDIDKAVKPLMEDKKLNISTLAVKFDNAKDIQNPNKVKVVFDRNGYALYFSRSVIPYTADCTDLTIENEKYYKHIGLYAYRKKFLLNLPGLKRSYIEDKEKLEQLRFLENGERIKVIITANDSLSVDTEEDLQKIRALYG
jgi:3-deoxy-manno-octulosonate cytidylyltransferase (CMP-KDO synthetase)